MVIQEKKENNYKMRSGLKFLPHDSRDFKLGAIVKLPELSELPENFTLQPLTIKHQKGSDFCTAFASCGISELQEKVELSPEWSFAVSKMISGNVNGYGQDLRSAMKAHQKYGAVEARDNNYSMENYKPSLLRKISNYPDDLFEKALEHKKRSYFSVEGQYDPFNNIRAVIHKFRKLKRAVILGVMWNWGLDEAVIPDIISGRGFGHAVYCVGWKKVNGETRLIIVNSYGKESGDKGLFYFPKDVINYSMKRFGSFMFIDENPEEMKHICWTKWQLFIYGIKNLFKGLLKNIIKIFQ